MGYTRYLREKSAKARRKEKFAKNQQGSKHAKHVEIEDDVYVPHPTIPKSFILKKKK